MWLVRWVVWQWCWLTVEIVLLRRVLGDNFWYPVNLRCFVRDAAFGGACEGDLWIGVADDI